MRATGIIRRVDDLGRVVIPKEIRKNCNIKEGDPLEIFIETNNGVPSIVFTPYHVEKSVEWEAAKDAFAELSKEEQQKILLGFIQVM